MRKGQSGRPRVSATGKRRGATAARLGVLAQRNRIWPKEHRTPKEFLLLQDRLMRFASMTGRMPMLRDISSGVYERVPEPAHYPHYFNVLLELYQRIARGNPKMAGMLAKNFFDSDFLRKINSLMRVQRIRPITLPEVKRLIASSYRPPISTGVDVSQLTDTMEHEIRRFDDKVGVVRNSALNGMKSVFSAKTDLNAGEIAFSPDSFVSAINTAYNLGLAALRNPTPEPSEWVFEKEFIADLLASGLNPKRFA